MCKISIFFSRRWIKFSYVVYCIAYSGLTTNKDAREWRNDLFRTGIPYNKRGCSMFWGKIARRHTMGQLLWDLNGYIGSRPQLPSPIKEIKLISLQSYLPFFLYLGRHLNKALYKILVRILWLYLFNPECTGGVIWITLTGRNSVVLYPRKWCVY